MLHGNYSIIGGAEIGIHHQITKLRERGHEILLFCFGDKNIDEKNLIVIEEPKSNFLRYVYQFLINPKGYAKLKKTIKSFNPDVIHLHNIDKHILTFLLPVKNYKTIRTVHDFGIVCPSFWGVHKDDRKVCEQGIGIKCLKHKCIHPLAYPFYYYLFKIKHYFQQKRVDGFIVASELLKEYMKQQGFRSISVFPNFTIMRDDLHGNSREKNILFVGKLEANKGCESLIRAFNIVIENISDTALTLVGCGADESKLRKLSESLKIDKNINFAGSIPSNEIAKYYLNSAVVVPSICMDNSPMVIYEALSFGKPVIATNRGGIPDLIKDGYNGFLVDANNSQEMADAIINILNENNAQLYRVIAKNAIWSSQQYDIDKYIDNLEMVYSTL